MKPDSSESFLTESTPGLTIEEILDRLDTPVCEIPGSNCTSYDRPAVRGWNWRLVEA